MKFKIKKILLISVLIGIILFSICPKAFATNGNEINISSKTGIGKTIEIVSGSTNSIRSESVADVVTYLTGRNITVNSIVNHKRDAVELTSTALIGTGYVLDTSSGVYSVIVYGDANGDGEVDAGDMKIIIDNFLGIKQASPIAKIAVDVYKDGDLDAADLKQVLDSFLGNLTGSILKTTNDASHPTPPIDNTNPQIKVGGETIALTPENAPDYYGEIVTNYSANSTATWRLFFVDFDGKYGGKGTIYLKADRVGDIQLNNTESINSADALNLMKAMNPKWWGGTDNSHEKAVLYLCDETKWSNYKNTSKADKVMGAPSVEMWIDSYNQYHKKRGTYGYQEIKCGWTSFTKDTCGYRYSVGDGDYDDDTESNVLIDTTNMYISPDNRYGYWLASPNFFVGKVCVVGYSSLGGLSWSTYSGICPLVSLKNEIIPEILPYVEPTPTPTPTTIPSSWPKIKVEGHTITLTPETAPDYYGKVVTNYSANATAIWRLFYVDFYGKYGDIGKVYLKADEIELMLGNVSEILSSANSTSALNKMKQMNPEWAARDGKTDLRNEQATLYLCDETKWSNYKNTSKADGVMGSPGIEMYIDSYNQYHSKKGTNGYELVKYKWCDMTLSGNTKGYMYAIGTNNEDYTHTVQIAEDENNMYVKENGIALASPCAWQPWDNDPFLCCAGWDSKISGSSYMDMFYVSPIVSLKSDVISELSN